MAAFAVKWGEQEALWTLLRDCPVSTADGKTTVYSGYIWPMAVQRGATQKVRVKYALLLPLNFRVPTLMVVAPV